MNYFSHDSSGIKLQRCLNPL